MSNSGSNDGEQQNEIDDSMLDPALQELEEGGLEEEESEKGKGIETPNRKRKRFRSRLRDAYREWYYDEAYEFFNPHSLQQDLRKSRVHREGKCLYLQPDRIHRKMTSRELWGDLDDGASDSELESSDDEKRSGGYLQCLGLGALWSGKEKQLFFYYLSRQSIHTVDSWAKEIPGKSKSEILTYYHMLRTNLEELQTFPTKKHGGILGYEQHPIAYEMPETWIALEEELSRDINEEEPRQLEDELSHSSDQRAMSVIDWKNWYKRWDKFYAKHRLEEYHPSNRTPGVFTDDAMEMMELLVRRYTTKLVQETVIPIMDRKCVPREALESVTALKRCRMKKLRSNAKIISVEEEENEFELKTSNLEFPCIVTEKDVLSALVRLRIHDRGKNLYVTYPESIVNSIHKFEIVTEKGKLFRNKPVLRHLKVLLYLMNSRVYSKQLKFSGSMSKEPIEWESAPHGTRSTTAETFSAASSSNTKRSYTYGSTRDTQEYKKQKIMDERIEQKDSVESSKYTHTLLTWLQLAKGQNIKGDCTVQQVKVIT